MAVWNFMMKLAARGKAACGKDPVSPQQKTAVGYETRPSTAMQTFGVLAASAPAMPVSPGSHQSEWTKCNLQACRTGCPGGSVAPFLTPSHPRCSQSVATYGRCISRKTALPGGVNDVAPHSAGSSSVLPIRSGEPVGSPATPTSPSMTARRRKR